MSSILKVNTIKNSTGTTGMTIDGNGRVLKSVLPAWRVQRGTDQVISSSGIQNIQLDLSDNSTEQCFLQGGVTLSGSSPYGVVVPVTGLYHVGFCFRSNGFGSATTSQYLQIVLRINNAVNNSQTSVVYAADNDANSATQGIDLYKTHAGSATYQLTANDYVNMVTNGTGDSSYVIAGGGFMYGHLIG
tara:strand:+ start:74 stop:637 length:564 start_codon:yes stop_codon:yes gene_type:complete